MLLSRHYRQALLLSLMVLLLLFAYIPTARAQGIIYGNGVPAGQEVNQDIILYGPDVVIDGDVHGDVLAIGSNVTVNGKIDGSLASAAQSVTINGEVSGSTYSTSLELKLGDAGKVGRTLYYLGLSLILPQGSQIGQDLYTASLFGATLAGKIERDTKAVIGPVALVRYFLGFAGKTINLPFIGPVKLGTWLIPYQAFIQPENSRLAAAVAPAGISFYSTTTLNAGIRAAAQAAINTDRLKDILLNWLRSYLTLLIFALLVIWLAPRYLEQTAEKVRTATLASAGWGLMVVVVGYIGLIVIFIVLAALAIFLMSLTLWTLGIITLSLDVGFTSLAGVVFAVLVNSISKIIVAFLTGYLILYRRGPESGTNRSRQLIYAVLLGLLIFTVLAAIPILGWVVSCLATLLGMGALWMIVRQRGLASGGAAQVTSDEEAPVTVETAPPLPDAADETLGAEMNTAEGTLPVEAAPEPKAKTEKRGKAVEPPSSTPEDQSTV